MKSFKASLLSILFICFTVLSCVQDDFAYDPIPELSLAQDINDNWQVGDPWVDQRDGQYYGTMSVDGTIWMTRNFNYSLNNKASYYGPGQKWENRQLIDENHRVRSSKEQDELGQLYSWESAQLAAPEGWRLPTSAEWQSLKQELALTGIVPIPFEIKSGYYDFDFISAGRKHPVLGYKDLGKVAHFWSGDRSRNIATYFKVEDRELEMNSGKIDIQTQLSIRYVKK